MNSDAQGQLVLAQNQHALIQDATKGQVQVYTGPHAVSLSPNDKPVVYDARTDIFRTVTIAEAVQQNPRVPEGHYLVLENPAFDGDGKLMIPEKSANAPTTLQIGRKINIPGPVTFPLWPGQTAKAVPGHHMRSNQYLVVRIYNAEEANKNCPPFLRQESQPIKLGESIEAVGFNNGQLLVIKGTEVSFFIPPTGFEVLTDGANAQTVYVREALTLERLEYCILLDEDGNKRYAHGPQVVFPEATETFVLRAENEEALIKTRKFKMIELNDQMGLYIKVIADYQEYVRDAMTPDVDSVQLTDGRAAVIREGKIYAQYKTGEELFITGKEQRIYCPRPEHALITYQDPNDGRRTRERYYGIAIPRGEGRYVLDKVAGEVETERGPEIFLPDPRRQTVVRRVLDEKTVQLWYPGNQEALEFNRQLRRLIPEGDDYINESVLGTSSLDSAGASGLMSYGGGRFQGEQLQRRRTFTPPPTLTLNTKYDGVPSITIWTGYAIQIVSRTGQRRVVVGPTTTLLAYDETLEVLELSTGKPKTTDRLHRDVFLRIDHNLVSDTVRIETKDLVPVEIKLSYRVNFLREQQERWFSVENYVKYLCDHLRSILKSAAKKYSIKDWTENSTEYVRDTVLGVKKEGEVRQRVFTENGMEVYDVEVLGIQIVDDNIRALITKAQQTAVQGAIRLATAEATLDITRREVEVNKNITQLETSLAVDKEAFAREAAEAKATTALALVTSTIALRQAEIQADVDEQEQLDLIINGQQARRTAEIETDKLIMTAQTELFERRMAAITPKLVEAMITLGQTEFASQLAIALAPLAIHEHQGLGQTVERLFEGTPLESFIGNLTKSNGEAKLVS